MNTSLYFFLKGTIMKYKLILFSPWLLQSPENDVAEVPIMIPKPPGLKAPSPGPRT